MENKKQYEKQKKRNYNQYIEEEGIKEEKSKENQKTIKEVLQPKLKGDENDEATAIKNQRIKLEKEKKKQEGNLRLMIEYEIELDEIRKKNEEKMKEREEKELIKKKEKVANGKKS